MSAIAIASGGSALTLATSNLTFYVSTTGSDSHDGLTPATAFATIQHAISVAQSFDYQALYYPTINVANGTYVEAPQATNLFQLGGIIQGNTIAVGILVGNETTPTNCVIAPNNPGNPASKTFTLQTVANWFVTGFSLKPDPNSNGYTLLAIVAESTCLLSALDFNQTGGQGFGVCFVMNNSLVITRATFGSLVNPTWSFQGTSNSIGLIHRAIRNSAYIGGANWVFNTAWDLGGGTVWQAGQFSIVDTPQGVGLTITNPGNVTDGVPVNGLQFGNVIFGADPTSLTLPAGPFVPGDGNVDATSAVDTAFYYQKYAGKPVDRSSIYRGSFQVQKDSNQTTAGLGLNLYVDDAGTVVPLIALTPAPGNLTFFVATTGSDSNPGTSGSPFATIQHAVNVAGSFDYQDLYTVTVNVANGTYHESIQLPYTFHGAGELPASLIGNVGTPTNVLITPNLGASNPFQNIIRVIAPAQWILDGFSFEPDQTAGGPWTGNWLKVAGKGAAIQVNNADFNLGTQAGGGIITANHGATIFDNGNTWTMRGTAWRAAFSMFNANGGSDFEYFNGTNFVFNSAVNLNGGSFFNFEEVPSSFIEVASGFTNAANITGGFPLQFLVGASVQVTNSGSSVDPTTVTWPSGPFVTVFGGAPTIDGASSINGFFYAQDNAGALVDQSTIYRGSWIVSKDTTNGPITINADDGGTVKVRQIGRFINTQTSTNYTLQLFDQDGRVEMSNALANTLTVPANATIAFPIGTEIRIVQVGAGATTIAGAVGVTVDNAGVVGGQWKSALLYKRGTNEWVQTSV